MKRKIRYLLPTLLFLLGAAILLYPPLSSFWNQRRQDAQIAAYRQTMAALDAADRAAQRAAAQAYNDGLPRDFHDAFTGRQPPEDDPYWSLLDPNGTGVMGYLEIPKIGVRLSIGHGTDEDTLLCGIGHLAGTSLPVGGAGTHCILTGHSGLPSAKLLTDLDQMRSGDCFFLYVLGEKYTYEVDQVLTVEPDQVEALLPVDGETLVTLVTCTPYGVNTHRLFVRGHLIQVELSPE